MTRKCCIVGCTSGYTSNKEKISLFTVPRDPEIRSQWEKAISREGYAVTDQTYVCEKHFSDDDIIRTWNSGSEDTLLVQVHYATPRLREGAVPIISPGAAYLRRLQGRQRQTPYRYIRGEKINVNSDTENTARSSSPSENGFQGTTSIYMEHPPLTSPSDTGLSCPSENNMDMVHSEIVMERLSMLGDKIVLSKVDADGSVQLEAEAIEGVHAEVTLTENQGCKFETELHSCLTIEEDDNLGEIEDNPNEVWLKEDPIMDILEEDEGTSQDNPLPPEDPTTPQKVMLIRLVPDSSLDRRFKVKKKLQRRPVSPNSLRSYVCKFCHQGYSDVMSLYQHALTHAGDRPFQCLSCPQKFITKAELWIHDQVHDMAVPLKCPHCPRLYHKKIHLDRHLQIHSESSIGVKALPSGVKPRGTRTAADSTPKVVKKKVVGKKAPPKPPPKPPKVKKVKVQLNIGVKKEVEPRPFKCPHCPRHFKRAAGLGTHAKVHQQKRHKCQFCRRSFVSMTSLLSHQAHRHTAQASKLYNDEDVSVKQEAPDDVQ